MDKANLQLNPSSMTPAEIVQLLIAVSGQPVSISMIEDAISAGVPVSASGHVNLVELIAWLERWSMTTVIPRQAQPALMPRETIG